MPESALTMAALAGSAFAAGAVNAIAGGGTLLTFPALLAVTSPVFANGTSTVALLPGSLAAAWGYRREVSHPPGILKALLLPSVVGGSIGTLLVTRTEERYFAALIPWLILGATIILALQPLVARYVKGHVGDPAGAPAHALMTLVAAQFVVSVYGGYFGAGIGILMLASLTYMGLRDLHQMNSVKAILACAINGAAAVLFTAESKVVWHLAAVMAVASVAGGYAGARMALWFLPATVRKAVLAIGFSLSIYYLLK